MVRTAIQLYTLRDFDIPFVDLLGRVLPRPVVRRVANWVNGDR